MKPTIPQLLSILREDLAFLGCPLQCDQVDEISRLYALENKPKKVQPKKFVAVKGLTLILTTGDSVNKIDFETEAKAEAWMKNFQKNKVKQVENYLKANGLYAPVYFHGQQERYKKDCTEHLAKLRAGGLDTHILIQR